MTKSTAKASIILAEDLRPEQNGKFTIVGTWTYTIPAHKLESMPNGVTNLAAYAEIEGIKNPNRLQIRVEQEDGTAIAEASLPPPPPETITRGFVVGGKFQNIPFQSEGIHYLIVAIDEHTFKKEFQVKFESK